jgi:hypothetical protein
MRNRSDRLLPVRTAMLAVMLACVYFGGPPWRPMQRTVAAQQKGSLLTNAADVLNCSRRALGGTAALRAVRALRAVVDVKPTAKNRVPNTLSMTIALPNRFISRTEWIAPGTAVRRATIFGFDGDRPLYAQVNDEGVFALAADDETLVGTRHRFARHLLMWLVQTSDLVPLTFDFGGTEQGPDGQVLVVSATGPDGFNARLQVDATSCMPKMLSFERRVNPAELAAAAAAERSGQTLPPVTAGGKRIESVSLSEYRKTMNLMFPMSMTWSVDGVPGDRWHLTTMAINPVLSSDEFSLK